MKRKGELGGLVSCAVPGHCHCHEGATKLDFL